MFIYMNPKGKYFLDNRKPLPDHHKIPCELWWLDQKLTKLTFGPIWMRETWKTSKISFESFPQSHRVDQKRSAKIFESYSKNILKVISWKSYFLSYFSFVVWHFNSKNLGTNPFFRKFGGELIRIASLQILFYIIFATISKAMSIATSLGPWGGSGPPTTVEFFNRMHADANGCGKHAGCDDTDSVQSQIVWCNVDTEVLSKNFVRLNAIRGNE